MIRKHMIRRSARHEMSLPGWAGMVLIMTALMILKPVSCLAQPETETEAGTAVLSFSSFSGRGPEYSIAIDDPQVVSYSCRTEYDDPDQAIMPGAGYTVIYSFEGLEPGTTTVTVSMYSPLMEGYDTLYEAVVDDDLHVELSQERAISKFVLYRNGEIAYDSYEIIMFMNHYLISVNGNDYQEIDDRYVEELFRVAEKYDLIRWDGFNESRSGILDGEGFRLEITFTDGTAIRANGDNAFPENYFTAMGDMQDILDSIEP